MKSVRKIFNYMVLIVCLFPSTGFSLEKMKLPNPETGGCDALYWLLDGVCVHRSAMKQTPSEMQAAINQYKLSLQQPEEKGNDREDG